eukprot:1233308-Rhodomonas_salina.2
MHIDLVDLVLFFVTEEQKISIPIHCHVPDLAKSGSATVPASLCRVRFFAAAEPRLLQGVQVHLPHHGLGCEVERVPVWRRRRAPQVPSHRVSELLDAKSRQMQRVEPGGYGGAGSDPDEIVCLVAARSSRPIHSLPTTVVNGRRNQASITKRLRVRGLRSGSGMQWTMRHHDDTYAFVR